MDTIAAMQPRLVHVDEEALGNGELDLNNDGVQRLVTILDHLSRISQLYDHTHRYPTECLWLIWLGS